MPRMRITENDDGRCLYCGSTEALSDDHVPPKALFPNPRPSNLITVRSCRACNEGASKDDEYFRLVISMRHDTGDHRAVTQVLPALYRSLQKPAKKGFQQALLNSIREMDIVTSGGIYCGTVSGYDVNLARLSRVATRITTGLFYHEFGKRLPSGYHVSAHLVDWLIDVGGDVKTRVIELFKEVVRNPPHIIGDGVFAYWFQHARDHDAVSVWVLVFYERVAFLCWITPKDTGARSGHAPVICP